MDEREHQDLMRDTLEELAQRLRGASEELFIRAEEWQDDPHSFERLSGKAQGVRLALSYVEELLR